MSIKELLDELDWEHIESDTRYLTHAIHRYSGKFIPQIAHQAIEYLTCEKDTILDFYCGSGTTLVEASLANRHSIGIDLNPLAVLISMVKTTPIPEVTLNDFLYSFTTRIDAIFNESSQLNLFTQNVHKEEFDQRVYADWRWRDDWYRKWFQEHVLRDLLIIFYEIEKISDGNCRRLALVAFSDILRKSSNAHSSYPNVMFDKNRAKVSSPVPNFLQKLREFADQVLELHTVLVDRYRPVTLLGNATQLPIASNSVDCIITHPPYIGSVPYAEYGSLSLTWLGHNPKSLDKRLTGGRRQSKYVVKNFFLDYEKAISEAFRVLKPSKTLFLMVGNPTVRGEQIDLSGRTRQIAEATGFELVSIQTREGINRRANLMNVETLFFFGKP